MGLNESLGDREDIGNASKAMERARMSLESATIMKMPQRNEAFDGLENTKEIQEIASDAKILMAIVGRPKTGKSWFAATAPGNVLVYDFDGRYRSLETLPKKYKDKVRVKTLVDPSQTNPVAFRSLEADLNRLKYRKAEGKPIPDSFVLDSGTYLKKAIENMYFSSGGDTRSIKVSPTTSLLRGKNWDTVNAVVGAFEYLITEYSTLGNLILVFHEKPQKDKTESTQDKTVYTDEITIDPQYLEPIISRFNEYFRIDLDYKQDYVVTCKPTENFRGSTTLLIDKEEKPSISDMLAKHKTNLTNKQNKGEL